MGRLTEALAPPSRRRTAWLDRQPCYAKFGPLQPGFSFAGLTPRQRAAARLTQLIVPLRKAVNRGDRAAYDAIVPEFDEVCAVLEKYLDADLDECLGADSRNDADTVSYGAMIRSGFTDWE